MSTVEDQARFDELKVQFGTEGRANELTLAQFANLTDARAAILADRIADYIESAEILEIRARAKQAAIQTPQPQAGKY